MVAYLAALADAGVPVWSLTSAALPPTLSDRPCRFSSAATVTASAGSPWAYSEHTASYTWALAGR